jgi:hypothetical protein
VHALVENTLDVMRRLHRDLERSLPVELQERIEAFARFTKPV